MVDCSHVAVVPEARQPAGCRRCSASVAATEGVLVNRVRFDPLPVRAVPALIETFLRCGASHIVHCMSADPTVRARHDPHFRAVLNAGDLNLPDGVPIVWALRASGRYAERVAGTDTFALLCDWGRAHGIRHYLYGGAPDVVERLRARLKAAYPDIRIVGAESPPFRPLSDQEVAEAAARIRDAGTDLLWLGLGTPKQEPMAERLRAHGCAPVILPVGAAFDFLSGKKKRAPRWMQRAGLEWAYRLGQEPRRLWRRYLLGNPQFVGGVLSDLLRSFRSNGQLP